MSGIRNKTELVLALLYAGEQAAGRSLPVVGITRLEKLLFLAKVEEAFLSSVPEDQDFHFIPFRMGPWTQEVYDETDFLESIGLIDKNERGKASVEDEAHNNELFSDMILDKYQNAQFGGNEATETFQLTNDGRKKATELWGRLSEEEKRSLVGLMKKFNNMNLRQFLRYVYQKHPEYTEASEIKEYLNIH